jgi:predicted enzyme related to lactoylglutathione lyase
MPKPPVGSIAWVDLTVPNAGPLQKFYSAVVGWEAEEVDMGGYSDFNLKPAGADEPEAGICNAKGENAGLPGQWLIYIIVADLERSLAEVKTRGGKILKQPIHADAAGRYAVIQDPAGAVCALYEPGEEEE